MSNPTTPSGSDGNGGKPKRGGRRVQKGAGGSLTASARREEIIRLALALTPIGVIASRLDLGRNRVSEVLAEPDVRERLEAARRTAFEDARAVLRTGTRRAAERLMELLESKNAAVAVRAAVEILSKSGADAPKKFDIGILAGATDEELDAELARIDAQEREAKRLPAVVTPIGDDMGDEPARDERG